MAYGYKAVIEFIGYNRDKTVLDDETKFIALETFGSSVQTNIAVGDMIVFTSWTPHRTYVPHNAKKGRLSTEVRLTTDRLPVEALSRHLRKRFFSAIRGSVG